MGPLSATSTSRRPRPHTVEGAPPPPPVAPRRAASGVLAALQALTLSLAVVVLPAVVAFLASDAEPGSGGAWGQSVTVAAGLWLLGHGVPLVAGGTTVTMVPLGLTALALFCCFASARRSAHTAVSAWAAASATYAVVTLGVALLAGTTTGWSLALAAVGGAVVGALGSGAGILARPDAPLVADLAARVAWWLPAPLRLGARAGLLGTCLLVAASAVVVVVWLVAGRATSGDIVQGLAPGTVGGVVLAVAQLAVLPNLVVWAGAWLVGPGFAVGEGTRFATTGSEPGALPAVPILGALPGDTWANAATPWLPALAVGFGVVAGIFVWRRLTTAGAVVRWLDLGLAAVGVVASVAVLVGAATWSASGAAGPGRLVEVGAQALPVALLAAAEVGGGAVLVLLWCGFDVAGRVRLRTRR